MFNQKLIASLQKSIGYTFKEISNLERSLHRFMVDHGLDLPAETDVILSAAEYLMLLDKYHRKFRSYFVEIAPLFSQTNNNAYNKNSVEDFDLQELLLMLAECFSIAHYINLSSQSEFVANITLKSFVLYLLEAISQDNPHEEGDVYNWLVQNIMQVLSEPTDETYDNDQDKESSFPSFSRSLAQRVTTPDFVTFEEKFLSLDLDSIVTEHQLQPLTDVYPNIPSSVSDYFSQFKPYIIEEARAAIAGDLEHIAKKRPRPYTATMSKFPEVHYLESPVEIHFILRSVPKFDHTFVKEALLVEFSVRGSDSFKTLAIGTHLNFDPENKYYKLRALFPATFYQQYSELFSTELKCEIHFMTGLTSYERQYETCRKQPHVSFLNQFVCAEMPAWPETVTSQLNTGGLNPVQSNVVNKFYEAKDGLYLLEGPPGTGKTTTIVELLTHLSKQPNLRIMVCAPSNKAVRLLAERFNSKDPALEICLTGVTKDLQESLQEVFLNNYAEVRVQELKVLLDELTMLSSNFSIAKLKSLREKHWQILSKHLNIYQKLFSDSEFTLDSSAQHIIKLLHEFITELSGRIDGIFDNYIQGRRFNLPNPDYQNWPQSAGWKSSSNGKNQQSEAAQNKLLIEFLRELLKSYITEIQDAKDDFEILLLQRAKIVFVTLVSSGRKWIKKYLPSIDVLIIDEATQAVEPEILIPFTFQPDKCLQVGDTKQLPATIVSKACQGNGYDSMMYRLMERCDQPYQTLTIQYRMHPDIQAWPSKQYYRNLLTPDQSVIGRPSVLTDKKIDKLFLTPCVFFHVNSKESRKETAGHSIKNTDEAKSLINVLTYLLHFLRPEQIGIITFYTAQVEVLKNEMANRLKQMPKTERHKLMISTVDGFQGEEKDVIMVSTVRTSESAGFLSEGRRTNVAMTRAKHHLFIFGNQVTLSESNTDYRSLLKHYKDKTNACQIVDEQQIRKQLK